jgi:hypothetical protein
MDHGPDMTVDANHSNKTSGTYGENSIGGIAHPHLVNGEIGQMQNFGTQGEGVIQCNFLCRLFLSHYTRLHCSQ